MKIMPRISAGKPLIVVGGIVKVRGDGWKVVQFDILMLEY
jgi:hypothetical protein